MKKSLVLPSLFAACVLLLLLDVSLTLTGYDRHAHFKWEEWPGFYAVFAFTACCLLVILSKIFLRPVVKRSEDYYDR